ncbi:hypothetical protein lh_149 [Escherichia phage LH01]
MICFKNYVLLLIHTLYYQRCSKVPFIIESY